MNSETVEMLIQKKIKTENFSWVYATQLYGNKASVPKDEISVYNEDTKKYLIFKLTQGGDIKCQQSEKMASNS